MAIYGALAEGFTSSYGTRPGEILSRGLATFASAATVVVTVPLPVRSVTHAVATVKSTTAPGLTVSVGNYSGNAFTIYGWGAPGGVGGGATAASVSLGAGTPVTFTATTSGFLGFSLAGATVTSVSFTRGAYGPVNLLLPTSTLTALYPYRVGDVFIITWSAGTPTLQNLPDAAGTSPALSSSATVEWAAWGTL